MPAYPYRARAVLKYKTPPGQQPAFAFAPGAEITVLAAADDDGDWLEGEVVGGDKGVFPASFVQPVTEDVPAAAPSEAATGPQVESQPEPDAVPDSRKDGPEAGEAPATTASAMSSKLDEVTPVQSESAVQEKADEPSVRSPTSPIEQPTLRDVTPAATVPKTTAAPPAPADPVAAQNAQAKPPPPAKKPNALASRIAAFQAAAEAQKSDVPPIPRPKPREWKPRAPVDDTPPPAASNVAPAAPASATSPSAPPAPVRLPIPAEKATDGEAKEFSAQDAADSISRGGGSLRDRIKLLQGGGGGSGGVRVEAPPPPGHAPKPKPWRRADPEPEAAETEAATEASELDNSAEEARDFQDTVVKDEKPAEDETTAQSPGPDIPSFEPAESTPQGPLSIAGDETDTEVPATVSKTPMDDTNVVEGSQSTSAPDNVTDVLPAGSRAPAEPIEQPTLADVTPATTTSADAPTSGAANANDVDDDEEAAKRAALAQRMAGLGGQRMGVPMPALPKRAAGPRAARKAKSPAVEPSAPAPPAQEMTEEPERASEQDVLASMGGASSLLAAQKDDDEDRRAATASVDDDDEFATPEPPARPPPPSDLAAEGEREVVDLDKPGDEPAEFEEPSLEADEEPVPVEDDVKGDDGIEDRPTIAEEAVEALPDTAATDDGASLPPTALRPPVPPPFARQPSDEPRPGPPTAEIPTSGLTRREPPAPSRSLDPPALASGAETIVDEPRPVAHAPKPSAQSPPPLPKGRPPIPPPTTHSSMAAEDDSTAATPQHPPVPTHPPPHGAERVTTAAEDKIIASMPDIVTPPEEAFDESTASPAIDAPSTGQIAQARVEKGHEPADMGQPAWGKIEGTETPAAERPDPLVPGAPPPPAVLTAALNAAQAEKEDNEGEQGTRGGEQASQQDEEEEKEEEEDPEVARRRALAARMAKLGGRGMMPPMFGGFGGALGGAGPKKPAPKKKPTNELAEEGELRPKLESRPVESQSGSDEAVPAHPPRRIGGIPAGGFALPGIAPARPPPPPVVSDQDSGGNLAAESEDQPGVPLDSPASLKAKSDAATDEAFDRHRASSDGNQDDVYDDDAVESEQKQEAAPASSSSLPPRRSVPIPVLPTDEAQEGKVEEGQDQSQHVEEPESFVGDASQPVALEEQEEQPEEDEEDEGAMPPPPPPPRPAGGHQSSLPLSSTYGDPASPPMRAPPSPRMSTDLARTMTQSSRRSSAFVGGSGAPISPRSSFDVSDRYHLEGSHAGGSAPIQANLDSLLQWSASLGAMVFAAAHVKASDKSARGLSDHDLIEFCLGRAADPMPPTAEGAYGATVFDATVEHGKKTATVVEQDEPRAGDIVSIHAKFKHALSTKTVGSVQAPHLAIAAGWDAKKGKLRVLEVDGKTGAVDEGSYKVDDMRAGRLTVYRVVPREYV